MLVFVSIERISLVNSSCKLKSFSDFFPGSVELIVFLFLPLGLIFDVFVKHILTVTIAACFTMRNIYLVRGFYRSEATILLLSCSL